MTEEPRKRIMDLMSEVAANPDKAAELAPEMAELGRTIKASPETTDTLEGPVEQAMCLSHDQVCRKHHVCRRHHI